MQRQKHHIKTWPKLKILALSFHCITLAVICQAFWGISPVSAVSTANNFYFKEYSADFYLSKSDDGTSKLRVVEELTAVFPDRDQNHGITRTIPFTNQDGKNLTMASDSHLSINVWHNDVAERPYKIEKGDGYFEVYIGSPSKYVRGEQVYRLEYEFVDVITKGQFETLIRGELTSDWQELYWDTNGNDWTQRFESADVRVHLEDQEIQDDLIDKMWWCYVGRYGESGRDRCTITKTSDGVRFTTDKLAAHENLTFVLTFTPDTFVIPGPKYNYTGLIFLIWELVLTSVILIIFFVLRRHVKDKQAYYNGLFETPEYTPPKGFTVAQMAENYIKKNRLGSSKVATLLEMAIRGKIEIVKLETKSGRRNKHLWQVRIKSLDLAAEQVTLLKIMAGSDSQLRVGDKIEIKAHTATNTLIELGKDFGRQARDVLRQKGLQLSGKSKSSKAEPLPKNPTSTLILVATIWTFANMFIFAFVLEAVENSYKILLGGMPLIVVCFIWPWVMLFLTIFLSSKISPYYTMSQEGLKYSRYLDGLKLYIKMAETERLEFLQSVKGADTSHQGIVKLYEKLLPYAALFKLEKSWLNELGKYYEYQDVSAPVWYVGVGTFSAHEFSTAMTQASTLVATSTAHSTTSNSSSGFSGGGGGGFSGGGGGGGGGGGW